MRMMLPAQRMRRRADRSLRSFFCTYQPRDFKVAVNLICGFYDVKPPIVEWFEYLDWGKGAGRTYENGKIHLVHPENWKNGRKYNSMKQWIHTVHHEMGHYLFWADAERKADLFAARMMHGLAYPNGRARTPLPPMRLELRGEQRSVARRRAAR